jgi:uncharacterized membrane protein YdbT with pleckstrin-like domain
MESEKPLWYGQMSWRSNWLLIVAFLLTVWAYGFGLIFLIIGYLRVASTEYFISNERIFVRHGLLNRKTYEIRNEWISSFLVSQGFMGKILNYGRIWISTPGYGTGVTLLNNVHNPSIIKNILDAILAQIYRS